MLGNSPMENVKPQLKLIIARGLRLPDEAVDRIRDDQRLLGGELDIDSIDILQIILEIERHFRIKLVTSKFKEDVWATIDTLAAEVESRLLAAGEA
jgi:acyl carrier protein